MEFRNKCFKGGGWGRILGIAQYFVVISDVIMFYQV
jgi:hypothetical protein